MPWAAAAPSPGPSADRPWAAAGSRRLPGSQHWLNLARAGRILLAYSSAWRPAMRRLLIGAMAVALGFGVYTDAQVPKTYSSTDAPATPQLTAGERADIFLAR